MTHARNRAARLMTVNSQIQEGVFEPISSHASWGGRGSQAEQIAGRLIEDARRDSPFNTPKRKPVTIRKFSWEEPS